MVLQRKGDKFVEVWEEGDEFMKLRVRLDELA